jgi:hypothetical protein
MPGKLTLPLWTSTLCSATAQHQKLILLLLTYDDESEVVLPTCNEVNN